jgi:2-polyprenyl-6-methoxyphenol hydroxylase-like FAD-dependent oxidoreductase
MPSSSARLYEEITAVTPPKKGAVLIRRAIVLGASMAGLMTARVLSDHVDEVLLVERDDSEVEDGPRPGVPQGSQVHALQPSGVLQLERWFPGFRAEAIDAGAVVPPADQSRAAAYFNGQVRPSLPSNLELPRLVSSRPFLESLVRRRTLALDNIRLVTGRVEGLLFDGERVAGVRYRPGGADQAVTQDADLVVDAMGRSSRLSDWLEENGWERPPMRRMPIKLNYATAMFKYDENVTRLWSSMSQSSADAKTGSPARIGGFNLVEGDRWIMLVAGYGSDRPKRDVEDYTSRCLRDFPKPFGDIAENAQMIGEVNTYHQADSRRRDFDELRRFPAGLIAAGDAVASFNPVYGQGMTSAMLHASCLSTYLHSNPSLREPAKAYFKLVRVVVDAAWQTSTMADLDLPHVDGPYPRGYKFIKWFSGLVTKAAMTDVVLNQQLIKIICMLAHPSTLARPSTVARVVWRKLAGRRASA